MIKWDEVSLNSIKFEDKNKEENNLYKDTEYNKINISYISNKNEGNN